MQLFRAKSLVLQLAIKYIKIKTYRIIIMPVVLYGYETWSLTVKEERRLKVFENMVLRRIFGPNRDEVSGECGKIRNEKLNYLYSPSKVIRMMNSR